MSANKIGAPAIIRILHRKYQLIFVDHPSKVDPHGEYEPNRGQIRYQEGTITICGGESMCPDQQWGTLFHEATHGFLEAMGDKSAHDEDVVNRLSMAIMQLIRDNPWLADVSKV